MKKTFYEKVGRRYKAVREYDDELLSAFPKGSHLVVSVPGGKSIRYNVEPNYAALIAAAIVAEDKICEAMVKASELQPLRKPISDEQQDLWRKLAASFNQEDYPLSRPAVIDSVHAGTRAMIQEADKLMKHESVRKAFEEFITVAKLCSDYQ